jgi:uncharacterized protein YqjF (DUF2071 family)
MRSPPSSRWGWDSATFIHFEVEPSEVQPLLPAPLRVDTFDGAGWAGLALLEIRGAGIGRRGWPLARFGMAEVRVQVRGANDEAALFVVAADVGSLLGTVAGRYASGLPTRWSTISIERDVAERLVSYRCRRRFPGPRDASCHCAVRVGGRVEPTMTDLFLLDRSVRYAGGRQKGPQRVVTQGAWPVYDAVLDFLDDRLLAAAGLPEPQGRMIVRFSPGAGASNDRRVAPVPGT